MPENEVDRDYVISYFQKNFGSKNFYLEKIVKIPIGYFCVIGDIDGMPVYLPSFVIHNDGRFEANSVPPSLEWAKMLAVAEGRDPNELK